MQSNICLPLTDFKMLTFTDIKLIRSTIFSSGIANQFKARIENKYSFLECFQDIFFIFTIPIGPIFQLWLK